MSDPPRNSPPHDEEGGFARLDLGDGAWVDVARGWMRPGPTSCSSVCCTAWPWQTSRLFRYDHCVEERRLGAAWRPGRPLPHPALAEATRSLQHRYRVQFDGFGMIQYRDGRDGQAFHRDTDMRWLDDTVIAILSLGASRPWLLRPRTSRHDHSPGKGATHDLAPAPATCSSWAADARPTGSTRSPTSARARSAPRISIQWRHARRTGRPFMGSDYRAPLRYGR